MTSHFPLDANLLTRRPFIKFICQGSGSRAANIALPMPGSMNFGDESTYNNAELGIFGGAISEFASIASRSGQTFESGVKEIGNSSLANLNKAKNEASIASIIQGVSALTGAESIQSAISIGTGTTLNKNITTEFTASNTRTFSFAFQLIATSSAENDMIKRIVKSFREGVYPEEIGAFQLQFPPKWSITFLTGGPNGKTEIPDIPKIGDVYLTGVTTAYNSAANMWRADGSPLETTITVSFIETKAHTLKSLPQLPQ